MLGPRQRDALFVLFCVAAVAGVALEAYLAIKIVEQGVTDARAVAVVLSGSVIVAIGFLFVQLVRRTFLDSPVVSLSNLNTFDANRNQVLTLFEPAQIHGYDARRTLITHTLKFAESRVHGWLPGSHFEFSVFLDEHEPLLFAYYDSTGNESARSMARRRAQPGFYVESGYEVAAVLANRSSYPRILGDTYDSSQGYKFLSPQQKMQVRSTVLLALDVDVPCALVMTSNERNAFAASNRDAMTFVRYIGSLVRYDLIEGGFLSSVRTLRPDLFSTSGS